MEPKAQVTETTVNFVERVFGASWRTSLSGYGAAVMSTLSILAALPYEIGDVATLIPPDYKSVILKVSLISAFILRVINARFAKDAKVSGGSVIVSPSGEVLDKTVQSEMVIDDPKEV